MFLFQFQVLQQQVGVLQDSANQNDERYTRAKADNAALQARVIMLEEQLRDTEIRYEEKLQVKFYVLLHFECHCLNKKQKQELNKLSFDNKISRQLSKICFICIYYIQDVF